MSLKRPCSECPFRKDAPRGFWREEHFQDLYRTASGDHPNIFACHKSPANRPFACAGWKAVVGLDRAPGLRALVAHRLDTLAVDTTGLDLFGSFEEMLQANDVSLGLIGPCCHCHRRDANLQCREVLRRAPPGALGWHCACSAGPGALAVLCRDCVSKTPFWVCAEDPTSSGRRLAGSLPLLAHSTGCLHAPPAHAEVSDG